MSGDGMTIMVLNAGIFIYVFKIINYANKENIFQTCSSQYEIYKLTGGQISQILTLWITSLSLLPAPLVPTNVKKRFNIAK
jgi:hypothetical protein